MTFTFTSITERFDPWTEIKRIRIVTDSKSGKLTVECVASQNEKKIEQQSTGGGKDDSLYAGIDNQRVKYVHGAQQRLLTLGISLINLTKDGSKKAVQIAILDSKF